MLNGITLGIIITIVLLLLCIILSLLVSKLISPTSQTPKNTLEDILDTLKLKKDDVFVELGSGDGKLILKAYERSQCKCRGYDISPMMILLSNTMKTLKYPTSKQITFEAQNIFNVNIKDATKIYCYLTKDCLRILKNKFAEYISNGGQVYSYMNDIEGLDTETKVILKNKTPLYIYKK